MNFAPSGGPAETRIVELTLRFSPKALAQLTPSNGGNPTVQVATDMSEFMVRSRIRIFPRIEWKQLREELDSAAPAGTEAGRDRRTSARRLRAACESSSVRRLGSFGRIWRAGKAWVLNRGLRDTYQRSSTATAGPGLCVAYQVGARDREPLRRDPGVRLRSHDRYAGRRRQNCAQRQQIVGTKTFTYERRCNPWRQLMEVTLETFPGLSGSAPKGVLKLDVRYLARIGVPLFRITRQRDGVSAIGELVTFLGYVMRLLLGLHIWSFRAPDKDTDPANDVLNLLPPLTLRPSWRRLRRGGDPPYPDCCEAPEGGMVGNRSGRSAAHALPVSRHLTNGLS